MRSRCLTWLARAVAFTVLSSRASDQSCPKLCSKGGQCVGTRCVCVSGFTGEDCEVSHCPRGDDPLTKNSQIFRTIGMRIWSPLAMRGDEVVAGAVGFRFDSSIVEMPASSAELNSAICSRLFSSLSGVQRASCRRLEADVFGNGNYEIKFLQWSAQPVDSETPHYGNPPMTTFSCDVSKAAPQNVRCDLWDIVAENVKEHVSCANHGSCNYSTGVCACDNGWYGSVCSENRDNEDIAVHEAEGPFFSGNLLSLKALRNADKSFAFLKAFASNDEPVFLVRGDGEMIVAGSVQIAKHLEVNGGAKILGDTTFEKKLQLRGNFTVNGSTTLATPFAVS